MKQIKAKVLGIVMIAILTVTGFNMAFSKGVPPPEDGLRGCRYSELDDDYCKWGPINVQNCVNNDTKVCPVIIEVIDPE